MLKKNYVPILNCQQKRDSNDDITEQQIIEAIKSTSNNETSRNDNLTKEFYETFWNELKEPFMNSSY